MIGYTVRTAPRPAGDGWRRVPSVTYGGAPFFWHRRTADGLQWYAYDRIAREWSLTIETFAHPPACDSGCRGSDAHTGVTPIASVTAYNGPRTPGTLVPDWRRTMFLIVFWHGGDLCPAVRVIRGKRIEADCSRDRVAALYDDPTARVVEIADSHDDYGTILADFEAMLDAKEAIS